MDQGHLDLDRWASLVSGGLRGRIAHHPVLEVFLRSVEQCEIPHECALELIEGARMDLDHLRYQSFSQLRGHCYRTTGMASVMMAHAVGFRGLCPKQMAEIGIASGLTSLLRRAGRGSRAWPHLPAARGNGRLRLRRVRPAANASATAPSTR